MIEIGEKLKHFRELRNYTQEHVAQQLEMTPQGYGKIERNEVEVTIQKLESIAQILGTTLQDIFAFDEKHIFNYSDFQNNYHACEIVNIESIKEVYEARIADLKSEISHLRSILNQK